MACLSLAACTPAFEKLNACYKKAGIPEQIRTRMYDTPHEFKLGNAGRGVGVAQEVALDFEERGARLTHS